MKTKNITNEELLNKILFLIKDTIEKNKRETKKILPLFSEDTYLSGLKVFKEPIENIIKNIDTYFNKHLNKNEFSHCGNDLSYAIYERKIFEKDSKEDNDKYFAVILQSGKGYKITNIKNTILYYEEVIIPNFIENKLIEDDSTTIKNIQKEISNKFLLEIENFNNSTKELSNIFSDTLKNICIN